MGQTSRRRSWNMRYISAVQRLMPRTLTSPETSSSSLRLDVCVRTTVPPRTLAERSGGELVRGQTGGAECRVGCCGERLGRQCLADCRS